MNKQEAIKEIDGYAVISTFGFGWVFEKGFAKEVDDD